MMARDDYRSGRPIVDRTSTYIDKLEEKIGVQYLLVNDRINELIERIEYLEREIRE